MVMLALYHKTNINVHRALRDDLELSRYVTPDMESANLWMYGFIPEAYEEIFNREWLDYLRTLNIYPDAVVVFYKKPNCVDNIHSDGMPDDQQNDGNFYQYGINWVVNPGYMNGNGASEQWRNWKDTGVMSWYDVPQHNQFFVDAGSQEEKDIGNAPVQITPWDKVGYRRVPANSNYTKVSQLQYDDQAYLVNGEAYHEVVTTDQPRVSLSLRSTIKPEASSWENVVTTFQQRNLLV